MYVLKNISNSQILDFLFKEKSVNEKQSLICKMILFFLIQPKDI